MITVSGHINTNLQKILDTSSAASVRSRIAIQLLQLNVLYMFKKSSVLYDWY